jgi:hypothetical protein
MIACHVKIFMLNRLLKQATSCRLFNYFLIVESTALTVESTALTVESTAFTVESTALTVESTAFKAESPAAAAVSPPLLQAASATTTAIAKNTFFIFVCLIFKNYNFIFIQQLKKGNPLIYNFFFVVLGYKYSLHVLI